MKFLIIDDERSLYKAMFSDLINSSDKNISEVPIFSQMPRYLSVLSQWYLMIGLIDMCGYRSKNI